MPHRKEHENEDYAAELRHEINDLKKNIRDIKENFRDQLTSAAHKIPDAIHQGEERVAQKVQDNPLSSVGVAAAVGFVLGALFIGRK